MNISAEIINKVFKRYENQVRMAELNKKENVKSVQGQVDRVSISPKALQIASLQGFLKSRPK
ncbi:MAG: hypothetical protein ACE5GQ_00890 [Nitrospinales bacterium]